MKKHTSKPSKSNKSDQKKTSNQRSVPTPLATPTRLSQQGRDAIAQALNPLVADAFALYVKTKNFHWHLSGRHFRDYHLLFDEQAEQIFAMIDVLAERVRKLGGLTLHSIGEISQLQTIKDDNEEFVEPRDMIRRLMEDNQAYASLLVKAHDICDDYDDIATESLLEVFLDETERRIWFLFETQAETTKQ